MSNRHGIVDTIIDSLAPVNRDGHKFIRLAQLEIMAGLVSWEVAPEPVRGR